MQPKTISTAIEHYDPFVTSPERLALIGFLAGYSGLTREAYALDLRQFATWCAEHHLALFCARRPTSNRSPGTWRSEDGREPPSRVGWAPSPASTATRSRRASSSTRPRSTSASPVWTTSPTRWDWTEKRWVRSWWPRAWPEPGTTPSCRCCA